MAVETEIKLRWSGSPQDAVARVTQSGYVCVAPRVLEVDQIYDRPGGELRAGDRLLRLRNSGSEFVVTYKGPADRQTYKSREEIECHVSDGETFARILEALEFRPSFRYEKYRTVFAKPAEAGLVTIDETPIGCFLELEGAADWIDRTSAELGFGTKDYITASYARLYMEYRREHQEVPSDMRF